MSKLSELLNLRATELSLTQTDIARMVGITPANVSQLFGGSISKPKKWREIASVLDISEKDMAALMHLAAAESIDAARAARKAKTGIEDEILASLSHIVRPPHDEPNEASPTSPRESLDNDVAMLPIFGEAVPGDDGRYIFDGRALEYVFCPPPLRGVEGAYASFVDGLPMFPRYKPGEIIWLNPSRPARPGDDVMVQLRPRRSDKPNTGYLRQFVEWNEDAILLKQYNGGTITTFQRSSVAKVHVVVFASRY